MNTRGLVVSGIGPGKTGTGRFVRCLEEQNRNEKLGFEFLCGPSFDSKSSLGLLKSGQVFEAFRTGLGDRLSRWRFLQALSSNEMLKYEHLLLIHPQSIGFENCLRILKAREHSHLYLTDGFYFCVRSYNFIEGSNEACLACLGGSFEQAFQNECTPFPNPDPKSFDFVVELKKLAEERKVSLLVQSESQRELARRHFGKEAIIEHVGLWAADWDFDQKPTEQEGFDIIFHGAPVDAKGFSWTLELSQQLPQYSFLFPFEAPNGLSLPNARFQSMSWETGLHEELQKSKMILVPSLWSAPIEGALVKSLFLRKPVGVVKQASAYSKEIPEEILLKLPQDTAKAAEVLKTHLDSKWSPDPDALSAWIKSFESENRGLFWSIVETMKAPQQIESLSDAGSL